MAAGGSSAEDVIRLEEGVRSNQILLQRPSSCSAYENGFSPITALNVLFGLESCAKCTTQVEAMKTVAENKADALIVMGTGTGKTAVVMGPALYECGLG